MVLQNAKHFDNRSGPVPATLDQHLEPELLKVWIKGKRFRNTKALQNCKASGVRIRKVLIGVAADDLLCSFLILRVNALNGPNLSSIASLGPSLIRDEKEEEHDTRRR